LSGLLSCGCCEHVPPETKDPLRARRERAAWRLENDDAADEQGSDPHPFHRNCDRLCGVDGQELPAAPTYGVLAYSTSSATGEAGPTVTVSA
jgi:hypothetical protein